MPGGLSPASSGLGSNITSNACVFERGNAEDISLPMDDNCIHMLE